MPASPGEHRGLACLEVFLLDKKGSQALLYVVDFSSSCALAPADFFLVEGFFVEDFEVDFFRFAFDARSPPSAPTSPFASAFFAAAAWRCSSFLGHPMSMQVIQGLRPPTTFISWEPHASHKVPKGMISPRGGSE
ncbi:MAG: hypothetical protein M3259_00125 [Actinomycetota bacterium]|nr:hypothetical protein [Actinomycetota bacterium]